MKLDDYVEYILGADNAPAMQLRIMEHYYKIVTDAAVAYYVGEKIRSRLIYDKAIAMSLRVKGSDLVSSRATVLFPPEALLKYWKANGNIDCIYDEDSCINASPMGGRRFAYRYQLNYKVHADPMHEIFDAPVSFAT